MSPTVLLVLTAAALLAKGLGGLLPDVDRGIRWVRRWSATRSHDRAVTDRRLTGLVVLSSGAAVLLLALGAPQPAALLVGPPIVGRALRRGRRIRRRRAVSAGAPLVARAIADGLDAGLGVRRAITDAARTAAVDGPAGEDLHVVAARLGAGDPLPSALDGWRRRTDEPAHATLIAGLLLHGEAGGELADVLRGQAAALDRARRQAAEAESAIVQARAAARIVGGIPVLATAAALVLAPEAVREMTATPLGALLVAAAVGLQVVALVAVRRLAAGDQG
ncbi:MAG: type II secretion system F family protein [Patulibacter sp.]|nr:type II secretion system F family protein [Patulibacter sp.]